MTEIDTILARLERIEKMTLLAAKLVLNTEDVAMLTGYSTAYIDQLVKSREIPYYKRGNRRFFDRDEVEDWMRENRIPANNEITAQAVGYTANQTSKC